MNDTIIKVENLSKRYRIGTKEKGYKTFREAIIDGISAPVRNFRRLSKLTKFRPNQPDNSDSSDIIWALKDVSFEVKQGEVIGIIGRNGAGKSTLLKILSRITEPTSGEVKLYGRVSSLLEVGTGFHPELTGRENIYLNGAILGMRKYEIDNKFDEIVDFAEIEKFIDTPVKRYSSGMYVRLAFAVAAHLEPEILMVDEVLAVGDAAFQKKCLGKMGSVAEQGRTVLFVSHNMGAVRQLCTRIAQLDHGLLVNSGRVETVIDQYLRGISSIDNSTRQNSAEFLQGIEFLDSSSARVDSILAGAGGRFRVHFIIEDDVLSNVYVTIAIYDLNGIKAVQLTTEHGYEKPAIERLSGVGHIDCQMDSLPLTPGQYRVNVALDGYKKNGHFHEGIVNGYQLNVIPSDFFKYMRMKSNEEGFVLVKQNWKIEKSHNVF